MKARPRPGLVHLDQIPIQPWAKALLDARHERFSRTNPTRAASPHPPQHPADVERSYFGHSIGWWDGDTLVIDTIGYNEGAWMERWGMPHTDRLHTIERITRLDFDTLKYEITVDDPGAYTAPWTSGYTKRWNAGIEPFEYVCQENNYGPQLMIGIAGSASRSSAIVP